MELVDYYIVLKSCDKVRKETHRLTSDKVDVCVGALCVAMATIHLVTQARSLNTRSWRRSRAAGALMNDSAIPQRGYKALFVCHRCLPAQNAQTAMPTHACKHARSHACTHTRPHKGPNIRTSSRSCKVTSQSYSLAVRPGRNKLRFELIHVTFVPTSILNLGGR